MFLLPLGLITSLQMTEKEMWYSCSPHPTIHILQILIDLFYLFPKLYPQETSCLNSDYAEAKWSWYEKQRAVLWAQSPFSHNWLIVNIFLKNYCQPWTVQLFHFFFFPCYLLYQPLSVIKIYNSQCRRLHFLWVWAIYKAFQLFRVSFAC